MIIVNTNNGNSLGDLVPLLPEFSVFDKFHTK